MNNRYPLEKLMDTIGYPFKNITYLTTALTHSSLKNERVINKGDDYERQEFLGDAVLELVVSDYLFRTRKSMNEGEMTKLRASIVCEPTLAYCAKEIDLSEFIMLGHGEDMAGSRYRDSIVSDVFEALIGALYLDSGIDQARGFIEKYVLKDMDHKILFVDSKTKLQSLTQKKGYGLEYVLLEEKGPDHEKEYVMAAVINGEQVAAGHGRSKKLAEQQAAYEALMNMHEE